MCTSSELVTSQALSGAPALGMIRGKAVTHYRTGQLETHVFVEGADNEGSDLVQQCPKGGRRCPGGH